MSGWFAGRRARAWIPFTLLAVTLIAPAAAAQHSVARQWNEALLEAIRLDYPAPTVHSRNLFHLSAGMYDAWAAYDPTARGYFVDVEAAAPDVEAARAEAISFAAYRILAARFVEPKSSPGAAGHAAVELPALMLALGYDPGFSATSGDVNPPAELGNRIAEAILQHGDTDGANEAGAYTDPLYQPLNPPMIVDLLGVLQPFLPGQDPPELPAPNHWQPLSLDFLVLQNGIVVGESTQQFLGSNWGDVTPFALDPPPPGGLVMDPGPPPSLDLCQPPPCADHAAFIDAVVRVIEFSGRVDPDDGVMIDISPGAIGNSALGTNDGTGHAMNPTTNAPYPANVVPRADFGRVLAEFWADGPESETPPGHWNTLANYVSDHPGTQKRIGGSGSVVSDLEWDVKLYLALNGAVHDGAIAAWGAKAYYDYVRPITMIRYMAHRGQSSEPLAGDYDEAGLPLIPGLIERVTLQSAAPGQRHQNLTVGKIAIHTWPGQPLDEDDYSGVEWIDAEGWLPYQRETFVTPPFAGYVSGHSTFSRAAAEVLTAFTGDEFFPGGLGTFTAPAITFLEFEAGPSVEVELQWATYYDAADQAGISRLWGGIHVDADDLQGRVMGASIGLAAYEKAQRYFVPEPGHSASGFACVLILALLRRARARRS